MLEDKRLKIFAAVVEFSNFTAAATSLGITQPAVSQNIAELERLLGVRLLSALAARLSLPRRDAASRGMQGRFCIGIVLQKRPFLLSIMAKNPLIL